MIDCELTVGGVATDRPDPGPAAVAMSGASVPPCLPGSLPAGEPARDEFSPVGEPRWGEFPPPEPSCAEPPYPENGGWPPGYVGWAGVPMGELAFDLFDLVGPVGLDPLSGGDAAPACADGADGAGPLSPGANRPADGAVLPPQAEPMLSAVLGVAVMDEQDCLDLMAKAARAIARWQAVLLRAQARFAELHPPAGRGERTYSEFAADEIACVLDISPDCARNRLATAAAITRRLPATVDALEAGRIDLGRALAMDEVTAQLSEEAARAVEDTVLARGGRTSHSAFRQAARRAALKADPDAAEKRRQAAKADRKVTTRPLEDGAAELGVTLPAELTQAIYDRISGLARQAAGPDEPRTMDQLRADAAADLLLGTNREHLAVQVHVTVPATTLLALADDPGELDGYGPIPAGVARELAENATWRRIITDPVDGTVLDVGRRRYPSAGLARHVRERDRTCRFPGCTRRARQSDIDHTERHADGGGTDEANLEILCRHHHRLKDLDDEEATGWTLAQPAPGHLIWISPTGRTYHVSPTPADHFPPDALDTTSPGEPGNPDDAASQSPTPVYVGNGEYFSFPSRSSDPEDPPF